MSDTPRTDAESPIQVYDSNGHPFAADLCDADFARQLERKLAAVEAQRDMLADELKFIATDKIANAADMRYRAHKALGELKGGDHE